LRLVKSEADIASSRPTKPSSDICHLQDQPAHGVFHQGAAASFSAWMSIFFIPIIAPITLPLWAQSSARVCRPYLIVQGVGPKLVGGPAADIGCRAQRFPQPVDIGLFGAFHHQREGGGQLVVRATVQGGGSLAGQLKAHHHHNCPWDPARRRHSARLFDLRIRKQRDIIVRGVVRLGIEPQEGGMLLMVMTVSFSDCFGQGFQLVGALAPARIENPSLHASCGRLRSNGGPWRCNASCPHSGSKLMMASMKGAPSWASSRR